jgi:hypothetical protein
MTTRITTATTTSKARARPDGLSGHEREPAISPVGRLTLRLIGDHSTSVVVLTGGGGLSKSG